LENHELRAYLEQAKLYLNRDLTETIAFRWNNRVKTWVLEAIKLDSELQYTWHEIFDDIDWDEKPHGKYLILDQISLTPT
jgi:hypothetical protein